MACEVAFAGHPVFGFYFAAMPLHWLSGCWAAAAAFRHSVAFP